MHPRLLTRQELMISYVPRNRRKNKSASETKVDSAIGESPKLRPRTSSNGDRKTFPANELIGTSIYNSYQGSIQTNSKHNLLPKNKIKRRPKPRPIFTLLPANRCPLFCCFYAEFDNVVGPKIIHESPLGFMGQDINITVAQMESILEETFIGLTSPSKKASSVNGNDTNVEAAKAKESEVTDEVMKTKSTITVINASVAEADITSHHRRTNSKLENTNDEDSSSTSSIFDSCSEYIISGPELSGRIVNLSSHNIHVLTRPTSILDVKYERNCLSFGVGFILRRSIDPRPFRAVLSKLALLLRDMEIESQFLSRSKVSTSTGNLAPSTPTSSTQQSTGHTMVPSTEDGLYLTNTQGTSTTKQSPETSKPKLQALLDDVLLSLNSTQGECNLVLNGGGTTNANIRPLVFNFNFDDNEIEDQKGDNVLNLKLFHPPRVPAQPVKDYDVPILLRRDWQLQAVSFVELKVSYTGVVVFSVGSAHVLSYIFLILNTNSTTGIYQSIGFPFTLMV